MDTLRQYWGKLFSRQQKPSYAGIKHGASPDDLERNISVITGENHALAGEVQRVRADFERARKEEDRKIVQLEQVRQAMELARSEDRRRLAELDSLNHRIESAREADGRKILELETGLAAIESERNQARDKVRAFEKSLLATSTQLEKLNQRVSELQASSVEQAQLFNTSLSETSDRLAFTDKQTSELEQQLKNHRQEYLKTYQYMQHRFRKQDLRLKWTVTTAGFALFLGTMAGTVLIWDVQRNATLLSGVNRDLKALMGSMDGRLSLMHEPHEEKQKLALPAVPPPVSRTPVAVLPPVSRTSVVVEPQEFTAPEPTFSVPTTSTTMRKPEPSRYILGVPLDKLGRPKNQ